MVGQKNLLSFTKTFAFNARASEFLFPKADLSALRSLFPNQMLSRWNALTRKSLTCCVLIEQRKPIRFPCWVWKFDVIALTRNNPVLQVLCLLSSCNTGIEILSCRTLGRFDQGASLLPARVDFFLYFASTNQVVTRAFLFL